jgi:hypothetical protein
MKNIIIIITLILPVLSCNKMSLDNKYEKTVSYNHTTDNNFFSNEEIKSKEYIENNLANFYAMKQNYTDRNLKALPPWLAKWIKSHHGEPTSDENERCNGIGRCGPCPGFCHKAPTGSVAVQPDPNDPLGTIPVNPSSDMISFNVLSEDRAVISFIDYSLFTNNFVLQIREDIVYPVNIAKQLVSQSKSFIIKKGYYPLSFEYNSRGETVIDIVVEY